jgi:hypothetical protein
MCHLYLRARTERNDCRRFRGEIAKVWGDFGVHGDRGRGWRVCAQTGNRSLGLAAAASAGGGPSRGGAQTGFGMSAKTWRTPKRSATSSPSRLMPKVSVA